ncbi:hypothetical protein [Paenibacillus harenae]|uniref:Tissue inhibitor of metalloproteinase n=1 Tax=Paenibacillus harenae TaxID=306543 RepID=A0ABT9UBW9_PAEHA|nr:hypothetical protein [Paenibacillus harenae]MDQ0116727.1 hypothetical protein [Paenibacillus harenae]
MKRMKWIWLLAVIMLVSGGLLSAPQMTYACSCVANGTVMDESARSDAVFEGTVVSMKPSGISLFQSSADAVKTTFHVNEVWKGLVTSDIAVISARSGESCGFEFKSGQRYLVYARETGKSLEVSLCSRTTPYSDAGEDIATLGKGSIPPAPTSGMNNKESSSYIIPLILLLLLIGAVSFLYARKRKRLKSGTSQRSS